MAGDAPDGSPGRGAQRLDAWAKINLTLHVTGRRADGYHELDSLVVFAGVGDRLEIAPAEEVRLSVEGPFAAALDADAGNLVLRAAAALRARYPGAGGARLRLVKRLPVAAGIGGGSADAAAALRGLNEVWDLGAAPGELAEIGAALGADVPVCLGARASFIGGIGDRIAPAPDLPPAWLVLVNPGVPLATPAVFAARRGPFSQAQRWPDTPPVAAALAARLKQGRNDLEAPARALVPAIAEVLAALDGAPDCLLARMSGSGATCFGIFAEAPAARAAAARIGAARPAWWAAAAPLLRD